MQVIFTDGLKCFSFAKLSKELGVRHQHVFLLVLLGQPFYLHVQYNIDVTDFRTKGPCSLEPDCTSPHRVMKLPQFRLKISVLIAIDFALKSE
jgi:hypothetical protein